MESSSESQKSGVPANLRFAEWTDSSLQNSRLPIERSADSVQQWSISFDVLFGDWAIGSDQGVLWFDEQFLYVFGRTTSFAVPGHRIKGETQKRSEIFRPLQRKFLISIDSGAGSSSSIQLDFEIAEPYVPEIIAFSEALRGCRITSDQELEGQLPPKSINANAISHSTLVKLLISQISKLALAIGVSLGFTLLLLEELRIHPILALVIFLGIAFQFFQLVSPRLWVAYKALGSLKRYHRGQ